MSNKIQSHLHTLFIEDFMESLCRRVLFVLSIILLNTTSIYSQTTFTVTSTGDGVDSQLSDGICNDGFGDCTLRAAIEQANYTGGLDTILFDIPGAGPHTIQPNYALPSISESIVIDGTLEPDFSGSPIIELDGSNAGEADGILVTSGNSTIRGLVINRFNGTGITLDQLGNNIIQGNFIGTNITGTDTLGNSGDGGIVLSSSSGNIIGGTTPGARNVISGNDGNGVSIVSGDGSEATENIIQGNLIGTDVTGTIALPNHSGIIIIAANNIIGGSVEGADNVISGNTWEGIGIYSDVIPAVGNIIVGNKIGTDITGTTALGNNVGVTVGGASQNIIGGTTENERNIISGNQWDGVALSSPSWSEVYPTENNIIQGNYIGTDITGTFAIGNSRGIKIEESNNNTIGGTNSGEGNLISGNEHNGIVMYSLSSENIVRGNCIGTDATGTDTIPNGTSGITLRSGSSGNLIGGSEIGAGNIISGNHRHGIEMGYDGGADSNVVQGNLIGTDITGQFPLGNDQTGISIYGGAFNNQIGGQEENAGNLIAYNNGTGILINNTPSTAGNRLSQNSIFGNTSIGIDLSVESNFPWTDGITPNDPGDGDDGPNNLQNFPEISAAGIDVNGDLIVEYLVDSDPGNSAYPLYVEFFKSDPNGSGQLFLGYDVYLASDFTAGSKQFNLGDAGAAGVAADDLLVTTASDLDGNTSEFSETIVISATVGIPFTDPGLPTVFTLHQNYPNPFNPVTEIRYELPERSLVSLTVYDLLGRRINELVNEMQEAGYKAIVWDATNDQGRPVSAGMYFYQVNSGTYTQTRKMILLK